MRPAFAPLILSLVVIAVGQGMLTWMLFDPWFMYTLDPILNATIVTWVGIALLAVTIFKAYRSKTRTYEYPEQDTTA